MASVREDVKRADQRSATGVVCQATARILIQRMARAQDMLPAQEARDDLLRRAGQDVDLELVAGDRRELDLDRHRADPEADQVRLLFPVEPLRDRVGEQPERILGIEGAHRAFALLLSLLPALHLVVPPANRSAVANRGAERSVAGNPLPSARPPSHRSERGAS